MRCKLTDPDTIASSASSKRLGSTTIPDIFLSATSVEFRGKGQKDWHTANCTPTRPSETLRLPDFAGCIGSDSSRCMAGVLHGITAR